MLVSVSVSPANVFGYASQQVKPYSMSAPSSIWNVVLRRDGS